MFRQELIIYNMSRLSSVGFWCRVRIKDRERHLGRELCSIISFWYLAKLQVNDLAESKCVVVNKYCVGKLNMARLKVTHNISTQRKAFGIPHGQQHWGEKVKWLNENQLSSIRFLFVTKTDWLRKARSLKKTSCVNVPGSLQYFVESKRVISTSQRKLISHLIYGSRQTCLLTNQTGLFTDTKSSSNKKRIVVIFGQENIESCTAVAFKVKWISKSSFHVQAHSPGADNSFQISIASV